MLLTERYLLSRDCIIGICAKLPYRYVSKNFIGYRRHPGLLLLIQHKLRIVQCRYGSLSHAWLFRVTVQTSSTTRDLMLIQQNKFYLISDGSEVAHLNWTVIYLGARQFAEIFYRRLYYYHHKRDFQLSIPELSRLLTDRELVSLLIVQLINDNGCCTCGFITISAVTVSIFGFAVGFGRFFDKNAVPVRFRFL